jgi:putative heme-binding domain-containing protein
MLLSRPAARVVLFLLASWLSIWGWAADPPGLEVSPLFARKNLVAWCIVPFDSKNRSPEDRAAMLKRLGFTHYAYDWRAEQLPTFDREVVALKANGVELSAVWFPANLGPDSQKLLAVLKKHRLKTQLWVTIGDPGGTTTKEKVEAAAKTLRPIAEEADSLGCTVGLYNHGGWFGEPENQIAVIEHLKRKNIGIVYNLHHGHEHLDRFPELLVKMKPHLLAVNLNGMVKGGEKILPLGQGELDLRLLKTIANSGYRGPIGILGHTQDDAEERLKDNLDGLDWLLPQLDGKPAAAKPRPRTMSAAPAASTTGWLADGKPEYRTLPHTVECRARVNGKGGFNILVASGPKSSAAHWELFTWPRTGCLTLYSPGMKPDHIRTTIDVCDKQWHTVAMQAEPGHVRLFVDGKLAADEKVIRAIATDPPGGLGFARLVEGGLGCDGDLDRVRISKGLVVPGTREFTVDEATLGLWVFAGRDKPAEDLSKQKNPARAVAVATPAHVSPPSGPQLIPTDPKWKATLIDRSVDDAYMAVKMDGAGNLFVGGREAVFVFEPDGKGGFGPRRELYRFPPDSIIIGLEYRGDDLYVLASHALYLVPGGRVARSGLTPKRILWGVPLDHHVSFHCLAWGPEGDLYLDHGDPLLNYGDWTRPDHWGYWTLYAGPKGEKVHYTGAGAVLKVRPDGSQPRVVARGLRGPVGLAFDPNWNLFTNDNDHESRADLYAPIRLLHVTPHADFAWPRGWMASKSPDRADLLDSIHPTLGRGVPCDLAYYRDSASPDLRGSLLLCRWDRFAVTRYPLIAAGATFTAEEFVFAQGANQCRPTGITMDRAGRVFVTSHYLAGNVVTPHCPSDLVMLAPANPAVPRVFDETKASVDDLWGTLSGHSWEARHRAHTELLRRGVGRGAALDRLATVSIDDPAVASLPWLVASTGPKSAVPLVALAMHKTTPAPRLQALRALAAFPALRPPGQVFADALADPSPTIQLAGLEGLFDSTHPLPVEAVAKVAAGDDLVLRQTATTLLARRGGVNDLILLSRSDNPRTRLAAILAMGIRLTVPPADAPPPKGVVLHFPQGNSWFSPELPFADAPTRVDLTTLGPIGSYTTAQKWSAVPHTSEDEELFKRLLAALGDRDDLVRSQAAWSLGWLRDPRSEPVIARVRREARTLGLADRPALVVPQAWVIGRLTDTAAGEAIERGPIDLTAMIPAGGRKLTWQSIAVEKGGLPLPAGTGPIYAYFRLQSRDRQTALFAPGGAGVRVWHNARMVPSESDGVVILDLQPGSNDILLRTDVTGSLPVSIRVRGGVSATMPEKSDSAALAERLKAAKDAKGVGPEFLKVDWSTAGRSGDASRGRKLFGTLGCVKCHAITSEQTGGGAPSLVDAGKRFTPAHLAESVLLPDRLVADEFRSTRVVTLDGKALVGLVVRETAAEIEFLYPDTTRGVVKVANIEERKTISVSPMPAGLVKTPDELHDLIAYLLSDRPQPP